jgi:hypothetical protein
MMQSRNVHQKLLRRAPLKGRIPIAIPIPISVSVSMAIAIAIGTSIPIPIPTLILPIGPPPRGIPQIILIQNSLKNHPPMHIIQIRRLPCRNTHQFLRHDRLPLLPSVAQPPRESKEHKGAHVVFEGRGVSCWIWRCFWGWGGRIRWLRWAGWL